MRLEFDATIDDYLAMHEHWFKRSRDQVKVPIPRWLWPALLGALAAAGAYASGKAVAFHAHDLLLGALNGMTAGCFAGAAVLLVFMVISKIKPRSNVRYLEIVRGMMESGAIPIDLGLHVAEVQGDLLVYTDPMRTVHQSLSTFTEIEEHDDCLYLLRDGHPQYRLPKRAFASDAQQAEFRQFIGPYLGGDSSQPDL